jgi:hypothetical protein
MADTALVCFIAGLACLALWGFSGRDPLWWLIHALIFVRAAIALAWRVRGEAWAHYRGELPGEVRKMRVDLMADDLREGL